MISAVNCKHSHSYLNQLIVIQNKLKSLSKTWDLLMPWIPVSWGEEMIKSYQNYKGKKSNWSITILTTELYYLKIYIN